MEDVKKEKAQRTKESLKEGKDQVVKEKMASKRPYFALLAISIVSEVIATVSLKESEAFTVLGPSIVVVICYGIAISLLVVILRHLPLGLVYGIWGGIGTAATIRSRSYETVLRKLVPGVEITARPCPLFVPLVEAGYVDHSALDKQQVTRLVIAQYLAEVREAGVDTLILGCTHYPLIKEMIGWYMGRNVTLVDPAQTAAHHLERTLSEHGLKGNHEKGEAHFYVSDVPDSFAQTADLFLGEYKGGLIDQIAIDKY